MVHAQWLRESEQFAFVLCRIEIPTFHIAIGPPEGGSESGTKNIPARCYKRELFFRLGGLSLAHVAYDVIAVEITANGFDFRVSPGYFIKSTKSFDGFLVDFPFSIGVYQLDQRLDMLRKSRMPALENLLSMPCASKFNGLFVP